MAMVIGGCARPESSVFANRRPRYHGLAPGKSRYGWMKSGDGVYGGVGGGMESGNGVVFGTFAPTAPLLGRLEPVVGVGAGVTVWLAPVAEFAPVADEFVPVVDVGVPVFNSATVAASS